MTTPVLGLGAVQPHVKRAAEEISSRFKIPRIHGFATSGHGTNSDHYRGLALDVPEPSKGTLVAEWAVANAQRLGVKMVIWNRRITTLDARGWRPYTESNPHTDHVHISFNMTPGTGGPPIDTGSAGGSSNADSTAELAGCLGALFGRR